MFESLGEIKGVQHKIQIDPMANATPVVHPPRRGPVALREPLREWRSWESLRNVQSPLPGPQSCGCQEEE